jgi:hypothetical protein
VDLGATAPPLFEFLARGHCVLAGPSVAYTTSNHLNAVHIYIEKTIQLCVLFE